MTPMPLFLHAGAHRTGTSSFQMCLHDNRDALEQAGYALAYPGRDGIPSGKLALRLPGKIGVTADEGVINKARKTLENSANNKPLILSEENIPGRMFHFMKGKFYPMAKARCEALRGAWAGPIAHVLLVVRPYEGLYVSGYRKRAEDNAVPPFEALRDAFMGMDRGWPALVQVLRDELRPETLTVLPYAQRGTSVSLVQRLVGQKLDGLTEPAQTVNLSATDTALFAVQKAYADGKNLPRPAWKAVIAEHAHEKEPRGFAAFSDQDRVELSERYDAHLTQIAQMEGVTFG